MEIATDLLIDGVNKRIYQAAPYVCREPVSGTNTADATTNATTLVDAALISNVDDFYNGYTVHNVTRGLSGLVTNYDQATKTITCASIAGQVATDIYYLTNPGYATKELYTLLMNWADNQANMSIPVPMTAQTPNAFTLINGWFIDDETVKWLNDGAIETVGWTHPTNPTGIRLVTVTDASAVQASDIGKNVVEGSNSGILLAYNAARKTLWVRCDAAGDTFQNAAQNVFIDTGGGNHDLGDQTVVSTTGENLYVNVYTLGTLTSEDDTIYVVQNSVKLTAWWATGIDAFDVLIKVKELGVTIDSGNIIVFCRYYPAAGDAALYDHFPITLTAGRQAVPLATALDLNNTSSAATVEDYLDGTTYTITFAFDGAPYSKTLGGVTKNYDVVIDCDGAHVAEVYEACKYVCREGSIVQLFDPADNGEEYIAADSAYAPVKVSPFGTFAGGKLFGAKGVWIEGYHGDDAQLFQLISSDGTTVNPPNAVPCKVVALSSGDTVGMFMLSSSGGDIEKDTYSLDGQHLANVTTVVVNENIIAGWSGIDPPSAGYLRVVRAADGLEVLAEYTSWVNKTFTLVGTLGTQCESGDKVYIPIIDDVAGSDTIQNVVIKVLSPPSTVYIRTVVRHYAASPNAIVPWSQDTSIPDAGVTVNATRTTDGIAL
jgi:hypothetical protein